MDRDELARQGKQMASDLRDTVSAKVSENQDTITGVLGKAARWVDEKTGGKYTDQIGKAQAKVDEGVGWVANQGSTPGSPAATGQPTAPGAAAGDPAPGGAPTPPPPASAPPAGPDGFAAPGAPQDPTAPQAPRPGDAPTQDLGTATPPHGTRPTHTAPDPDAPRPPQV
ncbi:antitoxin [Actinomycetospora soli]|uniref:antitoxin n=1 Tax=Actinomycetospora soli TaxID=2893887 RepID=UPI001E5E217F|nr:antitoxin [Actinomycetospora soli]MCD2188569.1 antitoxin [Actinomycetospora soli]